VDLALKNNALYQERLKMKKRGLGAQKMSNAV
jgi:hypothetical protein